MAMIKCKMCGGDLNVTEGMTVAECEYCGTRQTVPNVDNEKKLTLFSRANRLRLACEFDKAAGVYENIVAEFPEEAEAYWGLVLCRYGIEYVDDPATGKKVPTCHRSSFDSILEDSDFEQACENADAVARRVYREEAKAIEDIRKGILEVSGKEPPYDIFICYKETDDSGERTVDSVLAQDVYDALTEKGYRVFFSRITLEDKLGTEYEPYIFAALNSAKVMLVFGTDYEYFNAVWVKNEWSRYLKLMAQDKSKHLIPCYKNVDAYDMPKEFQKLQGQDMGKVGAVQDLLRGIDKLLGKGQAAQAAAQTSAQAAGGPTVDSLIARGEEFERESDLNKAKEYYNRALDIEPQNVKARAAYEQVLQKEKVELGGIYNGVVTRILRFGCFVRLNPSQKEGLVHCSKVLHGKVENHIEDVVYIGDEVRVIVQEIDYKGSIGLLFVEEDEQTQRMEERYQEVVRLKREAEERKKAEEKARQQAEEKARQQAEEKARLEREQAKTRLEPIRRSAQGLLVASGSTTVGLRPEGTVVVTGNNDEGACNVTDWRDIAAICAGVHYTVGLKADGTVAAVGENDKGQCNVTDWRDIVAVCTGGLHTVGLRADGTVVAVGENDDGQCDISNWKNIVAVCSGGYHTVGLKADGTVIAAGYSDDGRCDVSDWQNIVAICSKDWHTVGRKADGTVVATGDNDYGQCNVADWRDVVAVCAGDYHTIGLKADGTVVAVGENDYGQCNVADWRDIVAVCAGDYHTIGLKADGTVVAVGDNNDGQCNVSDWKDIVAVCTGGSHTVGLKEDGTVVAVGENDDGQCDVEKWKLFDNLEQERLETQRRRQEEKQRRQEEERAQRRAALEAERAKLQAELPTIKGLFSGGKRRQVEARLAEIEAELKKL